jgi:hypothetical protein
MADTMIYEIELPGGEIVEFEGPANLSEKQLQRLADQHLKSAKPGQTFSASQYAGTYDPTDEEVVVPEAEQPSGIGAFLRGLPHEALFNFDDELAARANALIPGLAELDNFTGASQGQQGPLSGDSYEENVASNMQGSKEVRQLDQSQQPLASVAGNIAGALSTLPRAAASVAARLPQAVKGFAAARPVATAAATGAVGGTLSGAGAGEEGTRAQSAALGTLAGTAFGAGIAGLFKYSPAVMQQAKVLFGRGADSEAVQQIIQALKRDGYDVANATGILKLREWLSEFAGKPVSLADVGAATRARTGVGLRSPSEVQQQSIDAVTARQAGQGQRMAGDIRANVAPRTDVHKLDEDLIAARDAEAMPLRDKALWTEGPIPAPNQRPTVVQTGVEDNNTAGLQRFLGQEVAENPVFARVPNSPGGLFREVSRDANGNITLQYQPSPNAAPIPIKMGIDNGVAEMSIDQFSTAANRLGPAKVREAMADLQAMYPEIKTFGGFRRSGAGAGRVQEITPPPSQAEALGRISRIVEDPELQNLVRLPDAQKALGAALDRANAERDLLVATGQPIDHLPDLERGSNLDVRTLDYLKRFLDDEVSTLFKRGDTKTFAAGQANQVKNLRNAIRDRLRKVVPEYGDYLDAYKGSSEMRDALEEGRTFDRLDPEQIAAGQADRSQAGQELFRVGAARNLLVEQCGVS